MELKKLKIRNFKGIDEKEIIFGKKTKIFGDNATGKTSIYDAFIWLLFDKDSQNKSDFSVKPIGAKKPIVEVAGILGIDGKETELKKILKEKWTKKRGKAFAEFTGHTIEYFINGEKVKQKEYKEFINNIVPEENFKLLTNVRYFNEYLHWKKRREILMEISGDFSDEQLKEKLPEFSDLIEKLSGKDIEKYRLRLQEQKREINKELETIPIRIDEIERGKIDIEEIEKAKEILKDIEKKIELANKKIAEINNSGINYEAEKTEINRKYHNIFAAIENKRRTIKNELETEIDKIKEEFKKEKEKLEEKEDREYDAQIELERKIRQRKSAKECYSRKSGELEAFINSLRAKYIEQSKTKFEYERESICPACGQAIPDEKLQEAREKAFESWQQTKEKVLAEYKAKGESAKKELEELNKKIKDISDIEELEAELEKVKTETAKNDILYKELKTKQETEIKNAENRFIDDLSKLDNELHLNEKEMQAALDLITEKEKLDNRNIAIEKEKENIKRLEESKKELLEKIAQEKIIEQKQKRIAELQARERELAKQFESIEKEFNICDKFIKAKVELIQENLNKNFRLAMFKLFEIQINGGINPCCETVYNSIPYSDLNNGMKINIGLDIINRLSYIENKKMPIFIDNAESVTKLIGTKMQRILLIVSEKDKQLRVEKNNEEA